MHHSDDMRTTVNLPDHLLQQAKTTAAAMQTSVTALLIEGLKMYLAQQRRHIQLQADSRSVFPVCDTARPASGMNLRDTSTLLDID